MALVVVGSSLGIAENGTGGRMVEVRAAGRLIADRALLFEHPDHGLVLRLRDLTGCLPPGLPRPIPVRIEGELFFPLRSILLEHVALDHTPGVLDFVGVDYPNEPERGTIAQIIPPRPESAPAPASSGARRTGPRFGIPLGMLGALRPSPPKPERPADGGLVGELLAVADRGSEPIALVPAIGAADDFLAELEAAKDEPFPEAGPATPTIFAGDGAGLPSAIRRRDPLELPLLQSDEWQEWLASIILNGDLVSDGALVLQGPDEGWAIRVADLRSWRVLLDEDLVTTFNGEPFYRLADLPGAEYMFDDKTLTLTLRLPPSSFERTAVQTARASTLPPASDRGAFLDYDVLYLTGDGVRERLDALMEVGAFDRFGVLVSDFRLGDLTEDAEVVRLDSSFTKDFPDRRSSFRVGDTIGVGGVLGRPVRFGGLQYASKFATDPAFITFPLPSIGGLAEQPSVAEVFLNNTLRVSEEVPPGPFEIDSLPVITGAGEVQLRVVDLLGREQLLTQSYYVSPRLLRAGLTEYAYELGFEREEFNRDSFDYGRPLLVGNQSYGVTDEVTAEGRLEASDDRQALGAGASALLGIYGLVSGGVIGSHDEDAGEGYQAFADYEYRAQTFNLGLRTQYASSDFRQIGLEVEPAERVDQLSFGFGLGDYGRIGTFLVNTEARSGFDQRTLVGNYSIPLGPGSLLVNALQTIKPEEEFALTAAYSLPLGPIRSIAATGTLRDGASNARLDYRRSRGASDLGPSYRLATEIGEAERRFDGTLRYDAALASAQLDAVHIEGETTARANLSGSVGLIDGRPALSRRLGRAFGMVALPGHPDVKVYLENREVGSTDEDGYLFLPSLNPYQANRVRIDPEDLPLDTEIETEELVAVPYDRSGIKVAFNLQTQHSALVTLLDAAGEPLPAGLDMTNGAGTIEARVADRGLAYVKGTDPGPAELSSKPGLPPFRCRLPVLPDEPLASLGTVRCR